MKYLKQMFLSPADAILKAKREKNLNKTLLILVKEWLMIAIGLVILSVGAGSITAGTLVAAMVFVFGIIGTLFCGYLIQKIFVTLGGKGKYFEGLSTKVYAIYPLALGMLISSILALIPIVGSLLVFLVIAVSTVLSAAALYRGAREFFGTDMITSLVGISILVGALFLTLYITLFFTLAGNIQYLKTIFSQLSALRTAGTWGY